MPVSGDSSIAGAGTVPCYPTLSPATQVVPEVVMVKRKAKETGASIPDNEPRRSSRRKSAKEEVVEEKPVAARPAKKTKTVPEAKAEDKVGLDGQRQTDSEVCHPPIQD